MSHCVALLRVEIFIPESHSLKERRNVMNSIKDKIRRHFNVSICEADRGEKWQLGELLISCVAESQGLVEKVFSDILQSMDHDPRYSPTQPRIEYYA